MGDYIALGIVRQGKESAALNPCSNRLSTHKKLCNTLRYMLKARVPVPKQLMLSHAFQCTFDEWSSSKFEKPRLKVGGTATAWADSVYNMFLLKQPKKKQRRRTIDLMTPRSRAVLIQVILALWCWQG